MRNNKKKGFTLVELLVVITTVKIVLMIRTILTTNALNLIQVYMYILRTVVST